VRILYLHGFASGPQSSKARIFAQRFEQIGVRLEVPDLAAGDFEHLTLTGQLRVIEQVAGGDAVCLIGSSLGGYLAALYAARHPETVKVVLMAPAFGFAKRWPERMGMDALRQWEQSGWLPVYHYAERREARVWFGFLEDGRRYEDYPDVTQPCLLFHGVQDDVVTADWSQTFAESRPNVELHLEQSGHELLNVVDAMFDRTRAFLLD
jgi:uncharacterized protein